MLYVFPYMFMFLKLRKIKIQKVFEKTIEIIS